MKCVLELEVKVIVGKILRIIRTIYLSNLVVSYSSKCFLKDNNILNLPAILNTASRSFVAKHKRMEFKQMLKANDYN